MESQLNCSHCKEVISPSDFFCPSCGKKIKDKPLSTTIGRQIYIYLLSLLLPPLGLWPAFKYLRQPDEKAKKIGIIAVLLTIISIVVSSWFAISFTNSFIKDITSKYDLDNFAF